MIFFEDSLSIAVKGHNPRRIYLDAQTPVCNRRVCYGSVRILRIFAAVQFDGDIGGSVRYRFFERPVLAGKIGEFCRADTQCVFAPRCDAHSLIQVLPHEGLVFFPEFHRRFLQFFFIKKFYLEFICRGYSGLTYNCIIFTR